MEASQDWPEDDDPFEEDMEALREIESQQGPLDQSPVTGRRLQFEADEHKPAESSKRVLQELSDDSDEEIDLVEHPKAEQQAKKPKVDVVVAPKRSWFSIVPPWDSDFQRMTSSFGERIYLLESPEPPPDLSKVARKARNYGRLLATPIEDLISQAEREIEQQLRKAHEMDISTPDASGAAVVPPKTQLWVDKYAPASFADLLSDEQVNRRVLRIVKSFDSFVFPEKSRKKAAMAKPGPSSASKPKRSPGKAAFASPSKGQFGKPGAPVADDDVPQLLLLAGPPGIGKTTLAHIIGRHAGYNTVEINASDDRSAAVFRSKVSDAIAMQSNWMGSGRPNLLVIDEIDGITDTEGHSAVQVLLDVMQGKALGEKPRGRRKSKKRTPAKDNDAEADADAGSDDDDASDAAANNKPARPRGLQRPIICICNNLYAPVLRKLRQAATVLKLDKPRQQRLCQRLKEICRQEGLQVDFQTLQALYELTDGDIRSCLNTLQFIRSQSRVVSPQLLASAAIGQKDATRSIFDTWNQIFRLPNQQLRNNALNRLRTQKLVQDAALARLLSDDAPRQIRIPTPFDELLDNLSGGDNDWKVTEGCFENYLVQHLSDPTFTRITRISEWSCYADIMWRHVFQEMDAHQLAKYTVVAPLAYHKLFAQNLNPILNWPRADQQLRTSMLEADGVVRTFLTDCSPQQYFHHLPVQKVALEFVSDFIDILTPQIRQMNLQLLGEKERSELRRVIQVMIEHHVAPRSLDLHAYADAAHDQDLVRFEPGIDALAIFDAEQFRKRHRVLTPVMNQLIGQEVQREMAMRADARRRQSLGLDNKEQAQHIAESVDSKEKEAEKVKPGPSQPQVITNTVDYMRSLASKPAKAAPVTSVAKDFFGRVIDGPKPGKKAQAATAAATVGKTPLPPNSKFRFKFHEGFTNAVRRTVYMSDLL